MCFDAVRWSYRLSKTVKIRSKVLKKSLTVIKTSQYPIRNNVFKSGIQEYKYHLGVLQPRVRIKIDEYYEIDTYEINAGYHAWLSLNEYTRPTRKIAVFIYPKGTRVWINKDDDTVVGERIRLKEILTASQYFKKYGKAKKV